MPARTQTVRPARSHQARLLALTTLAIGVLLAGCGGSSAHLTAATADGATGAGPTSATGGATNSGSTASGTGGPSGLAFARCMRAHGVPNFPDPSPGGGLVFDPAGINPSSPAFESAHARCQQLLPAGGLPAPGTQTHPSAQTVAKLLGIARCMRQHGVPQFPDPRTSVPSDFGPGKYRGLTDFDGAILVWPTTLNMQSPAYTQSAAACGPLAQKLGLSHPH
jgi:hypothetical protein